MIKKKDYSLQHLLHKAAIEIIEINPTEKLQNVNTKEEYEEVKKKLS